MGFKEGLQSFFHQKEGNEDKNKEKEGQVSGENEVRDNDGQEYRVGDKVPAWSNEEGKIADWMLKGPGKELGKLAIWREVVKDGVRQWQTKEIRPSEIRTEKEVAAEVNQNNGKESGNLDFGVQKESPELHKEYKLGDKVRAFSRSENKVLDWEVVKHDQVAGTLRVMRKLPDGQIGMKNIAIEDVVNEEEEINNEEAAV